MKDMIRVAGLSLFGCIAVFSATAFADQYPIDGRFGVAASSAEKTIDCSGRRVISFFGNQRSDTGGGVPAFRNETVAQRGANAFSIVDVFTTGQIANAKTRFTLTLLSRDRAEMVLEPSGSRLSLHRCK